MKVFISWSGDASREVAQYLREWLSCVLQNVKPWISTRDIDRGSLWFGEISGQLQEAAVGIICLTEENKNQPWILFEAGALAKGLSTARVCTLLVDLKPSDIRDPLAQFNHTMPDRDGMHSLVSTLNSALPAGGLEEKVLDRTFATYWPQFEAEFEAIKAKSPTKGATKAVNQNDMLRDVLDSIRFISNRLDRIEVKHSWSPASVSDAILREGRGFPVNGANNRKKAYSQADEMLAQGTSVPETFEFVKDRLGLTEARIWLSRQEMASKSDGVIKPAF